jgi:hypothetical protein
MEDRDDRIFLDGDFNDGYESRIRKSTGKKRIKYQGVKCNFQKGYMCFEIACNKANKCLKE